MTTTIAPALGHGPLTQQGTGTTPGYDAIDARRWMTDPDLGEGVTTYGTYRVSQRGAGANMSVDVNQDDFAFVRGDAVTLQALYKAPPHVSTINETISTADATNPRIDRVILELKDTQHDASGSSLFQTRVITGTPTGGATLDNLNGVGAVPSSALLLADVLVGAAVASITNANIRDRRAFIAPGTVPPVLTAVDMVVPTSPLPDHEQEAQSVSNNNQVAGLIWLPRRIVSATKIRWIYGSGGTAVTGTYALGMYEATGRKIVDTGSTAFAGVINSLVAASVTITATTFEAGWYYGVFGFNTTAGTFKYPGFGAGDGSGSGFVPAPNMFLYSTSGAATLPQTILGFTDMASGLTGRQPLPRFTLSVG